MFKKDLDIKPASTIKSSEKRKLEQLLGAEMNGLKIPNKLSKAIFNTNEISKGTMYFNAETKDPFLFQLRDNKLIIPTLQTLWSSATSSTNELVGLPYIRTHAAVTDRLINGANLMIRGCHGPYVKGLKKGSVVAVIDYKRPKVAVAIGICQMNLEGLEDSQVPDSGVAVHIYTAIGDKLASLGRNMDKVLVEAGELNVEEGLPESDVPEKKPDDRVELQNATQKLTSLSLEQEENVGIDENLGGVSEYCSDDYEPTTEDETEDEEEVFIMSTEDIDEIFRRSVMYTLSQDNVELPITATQLMSAHVLHNLPLIDSDIVNMKKTSWKKTAKFLKTMEREGFLKLKGKDDKLTITSLLTRSDPRIANFVPYSIKKTMKTIDINQFSGKMVEPLIIKDYLKPNSAARMLFNNLNEDFFGFYTEQEIKGLIQKYVRQHPELVSKGDAQMIVPDSILEHFNINNPIMRADLYKYVAAFFSPYHCIYREGDDKSDDALVRKRLTPKKGKLPGISISVESLKVGRKVITRISGLENYHVDIDKFANSLKVKCSGSTTISDGKEAKDHKLISVQGPHDNTAMQILYSEWGVPFKVCCSQDKSRKRFKKKKRKH